MNSLCSSDSLASTRARTKICGITRVEDAVHAADCGADAVGLVFWKRSSRSVEIRRAIEICAALPPLVMRVGLFMDAAPEWIAEVLDAVPLHLLQFHGSEAISDCEKWNLPYIKALAMAGVDSEGAAATMQRWRSASGFVLDGHGAGEAGGSGIRFDWSQVPGSHRDKIIIAGGLNPGNVGLALRESGARAVDVSSGVESAPGIKDPVLVKKFIEETARA